MATQPDDRQLGGVFAAVSTPLTADLEPDLPMFVAHCRWLLANGCDGLAPLGTTGEANSLSLAQRRALVEGAAQAGLPMERMIVGGGSCALADAVELTRVIVAAGGGGVLLLPPFYYKKPTDDGLFAFFSEVIERVGSDRLRLYLYHFPLLSTVPITLPLIARLKAAYGPVIAGVKDSTAEWDYTPTLLKEFPGIGGFSGSEEFLLRNLRAGGVGCISATTNFTCPLARPVRENWRDAGADVSQAQLLEVRLLLQAYPMQAAVKEALAIVTGNPAWRRLLPPNRPLTEAQGAELKSRLEATPQVRPLLARRAA